MKIEIDLDDIIGDEFGNAQGLADAVRKQVLDALSTRVTSDVKKLIDETINKTIQDGVNAGIKERLPEMIKIIFEEPYTIIDRYGSRGQTTTVRQELVKAFTGEMNFQKNSNDYDNNAFTKAIIKLVEDKVSEFKKDFNKQVDAKFTTEALQYAEDKLKKKLGIQ